MGRKLLLLKEKEEERKQGKKGWIQGLEKEKL